MAVGDYETMLKKQGYRCAICSRHEDECATGNSKHAHLYVDHCHETGRVRGLLCLQCNHVIGYAHDSIETLSSAITYLRVTKH